jgi:hypothetical protein
MELLGDVSHVEFRFSPLGDSVSVGGNLILVCLETVLVSVQDMFIVCASVP